MKNTMPTFKPTRPYLVYALHPFEGWDILSECSSKKDAITAFNRDRNEEWVSDYTSFALTDIRTGEVLRQVWK